MKFTVILDQDEDGVFVVECPAIPGCARGCERMACCIRPAAKPGGGVARRLWPYGATRSSRLARGLLARPRCDATIRSQPLSQGKTEREALRNIKEAIRLCLEVRAERGMPLTVSTREVEISLR